MIHKKGFTLIEVIIGIFIFALIGFSVWQVYSYVSELVRISKIKAIAIALANEQIELIRNLPYADVGIINSIPPGKLPATRQITRDNITFTVAFTIRNIDDPFDGYTGTDADYKLVEVEISCSSCRNFSPLRVTTTVAPKNLETTTNNGALFIRALDANGQPVKQANVHIENNQVSPPIIVNDTTDDNGWLQIIDVPPGFEAYEITVTKNGYSEDKTYPRTQQNPNPIKPHATVVAQEITQISFAIDKVSTLNVYTVNQYCSRIGNINFRLQGAKLIGTDPDIYKYSENHQTNSNGVKTISNLEWDNYNLNLLETNYMLAGSIPLIPFNLNPNTVLDLFLTLRISQPKAILVKVFDASTQLPLSGATVRMQKPGWKVELLTGRGYLRQTDWSGGSGQENFDDETKYWSQDGNIETNNPAGEIKLVKIGRRYQESGWLISSTFDTGGESNFYNILWEPLNQPEGTEVKFQIATSSVNPPQEWVFKGPDGTPNTYYTLSNNNIHPSHNNDRYLRYKVFLSTQDRSKTPIVSDIAITYSSVCIPPGQAFFSGLPAANIWTLTVSKDGYQTYTEENVDININWQEKEVFLFPQ